MKKTLLLTLLLCLPLTADHVIPAANYGPDYLYPADPSKRLYKLPVAEGEASHISGGWCTDSHPGYRHADFAADFDTDVGQTAYCARTGRVMFIEEAPGGMPSYYTIQIGRVDSIRDSTSKRASGYRLIQTLDMYRHMNGATRLVNLGQTVVQGQPIAQVNDISHVHFEVNVMGMNFLSPVDSTDSISSIPVAFLDITSRPQGFPEMYDTYVSQNTPIRVETAPLSAKPGMELDIFPNPFQSALAIRYTLAQPAQQALIRIYDASGRLVSSLSAPRNGGGHSLAWGPKDLPPGAYVVRLNAGRVAAAKRVVLE